MADQQQFLVTARKWRPQRFSDVVGQEHITTTLKNAIRNDRIHHAYLFTGPRGVGKTTCARILARAINCPNTVDNEPCNACPTCMDVLEGRSVDVIEIDGASNNSVDDVRKLRDNVRYAPMQGRYKMYIIDEVHMLSTSAFNALLKTLEEPPPHLIFVFATTEIHKVPATILSRCQRFDFRRMEIDSIVKQLSHIASNEGITIDDASLVAIAKKADGSMRDSQSIFDQVVSFCGTTITYRDLGVALHLIDIDFFFEIGRAVREHDVAFMFNASREVVNRGYDLQECLVGLLEHFRNLLTVVSTGSTSLIDASEAHLRRYDDEAKNYSKAELVRIMTMISQGEAVLRQNPPQPRIRFEFTLVQLASMDSTVELGTLLAKLGQPAGAPAAATAGKPRTAETASRAVPVPVRRTSVPVRPMASPVSALSPGNLAARWNAFLDALPERLLFFSGAIRQSGMLTVDLTDVGLTLRPHAAIIHQRITDELTVIKDALKAFYGAPVGVHVMPVVPPAAPEPVVPTGEAASDAAAGRVPVDAEPLPIEQTIIELFKARRVVANE
ncbi:MAG: DNA polymerase III subunit gamma/tau [Candidatus Kapabacteria bacterium]|nr:DNA polymerase III subunit gamma/tau [Candidatus Kapabacteria bacterium]